MFKKITNKIMFIRLSFNHRSLESGFGKVKTVLYAVECASARIVASTSVPMYDVREVRTTTLSRRHYVSRALGGSALPEFTRCVITCSAFNDVVNTCPFFWCGRNTKKGFVELHAIPSLFSNFSVRV